MPETRSEAVALATANVERLIKEAGLDGVTVIRYPNRDDGYECCFVLKRHDPRVKDHSKMEVFLTCRVDMPALVFEGDKVDGRLKKIYVDNSGWLWSIALGFVRCALEGKEEE